VLETRFYKIHYYPRFADVAVKLEEKGWLDSAFIAANNVIGYKSFRDDSRVHRKIPIKLLQDDKVGALAVTIGETNRRFLLEVDPSRSDEAALKEYGSAVAHETAHVLLHRRLPRDKVPRPEQPNYDYLNEALAFYAGFYEYAHAKFHANRLAYEKKIRKGLKELGTLDKLWWKRKQSWVTTGQKYFRKYKEVEEGGYSNAFRLEAIGLYLCGIHTGHSRHGRIHRLIGRFAAGIPLDEAYLQLFGKRSGQSDTRTDVNTLYADYYRFWFKGVGDLADGESEIGTSKPEEETAEKEQTTKHEPEADEKTSIGSEEKECWRKWNTGWFGKDEDGFERWKCVETARCNRLMDSSPQGGPEFYKCHKRLERRVFERALRRYQRMLKGE